MSAGADLFDLVSKAWRVDLPLGLTPMIIDAQARRLEAIDQRRGRARQVMQQSARFGSKAQPSCSFQRPQ
jgi:hypothetical protein